MQDGWVKVWRKVKDNAIFGDDALFKCWIYCLMQATHKEYEMLINGQVVKLMPGQFISGRHQANKDLKWKGKKFDRKMIFLEKHQYLTREVTNSFTKNTIINWDIYQIRENEGDQPSDQGVTNPRPTPDQPLTTNKNVKNIKNVKNKDIYGEFTNVKLTQEEYSKLITKFGEPATKEKIENLSIYLASKGKKYANHYATILTWDRKNPKPMQIKPKEDVVYPDAKQPSWIHEALERGWK